MEGRPHERLRVGACGVDPASGQISRDGHAIRLDVRTLRLLMCLVERAGEVVSIDELIDRAWSGVSVSSDSVYQAVTSLRRSLGDDPRNPSYIETVPRLGYRLVASVRPWDDQPVEMPARGRHSGSGVVWVVGLTLCLSIGVALAGLVKFRDRAPDARTGSSIAVLPFLDLTEGMKEEEFADGMTEELIDRISKIPGVRVPPPTSSFYFKNKRVPVADIARSLGVSYVLDGSIRKSGARLRVAARLIRPDNGYVIWSESYDRPWADILEVQDEIAAEVTKSLGASIAHPM
ncbi:MAG TPA: winged helix-turn-helix domain-containing protein [Vicinamibacterales bacterium]|jgi:TolB-like protein/DNA-binding winged helix-turn-helix (wHTH) protein